MNSRRLLKAAQAIRQVVSMAILAELKDPRVQNVTVTKVEVAPDMRTAKVYVSIMGDDKQQKLVLAGLRSSAGFLQSRIAEEIDTRYTPRIEFVVDLGVKKSIAIAEILQRVLPPSSSETSASATAGNEDLEDEYAQEDDLEDENLEDEEGPTSNSAEAGGGPEEIGNSLDRKLGVAEQAAVNADLPPNDAASPLFAKPETSDPPSPPLPH